MKKIASKILNLAAFAVLFSLCASFVAIRLLGFGTYIVTGGSMEPTIHKGSLVLVQPVSPSAVKLGDVITFQQYDQTTTHRVMSVAETAEGLAFMTKGDANSVADPEAKTFPGQVGIVRFAIPVAGYAIVYVQAYWRLALSLIAAIVFFTCAGILVFRKERVVSPQIRPLARVARRTVAVTVETDAAWDAHLAWVRRSAHGRTQVA